MLPFDAMCFSRSSLFTILLPHIVHIGPMSFIIWFNLIKDCQYVCDSAGMITFLMFFLKSLTIELNMVCIDFLGFFGGEKVLRIA